MFSRNLGPKKKKNGKSKNIYIYTFLSTTPKNHRFFVVGILGVILLWYGRAWVPWVMDIPPFSQPWLLGLEGFAPRRFEDVFFSNQGMMSDVKKMGVGF